MSSFSVFQDKENSSASENPGNVKNGLGVNGNGQPPKRAGLGLRNENNEPRLPIGKAGKPILKAVRGERAPFQAIEPKTRQQKATAVLNNTLQQKPVATQKAGLLKQTFAIHKDVKKAESQLNPAKERFKFEDVKAEPVESTSQDDVSTDIAHLHIPDSNDSDTLVKCDPDMSIDSFCYSPMSIDKSDSNRRVKNQETLDNFYNVNEYDNEIYEYMKAAETKCRPKPGYMRKQPDITYSMRSILVDWLVEVADEYNLQTETLFLAVSYIDRFLSYMSVVRGKLQLVGTAAMFIASKFEEIYPPDVGEFVYITDDTYTKKQVLRMEHLILKVLTFDMSAPTIMRFALKYCLACDSPNTVQHLTQYLCELSMLDAENFLHFLPSEIGAAATALARHTFQLEPWPQSLQDLTEKSLSDLHPCLTPLTIAFESAASYPQQAVKEKFSTAKWSSVSHLQPRIPLLRAEIVPPSQATVKTSESTAKTSSGETN